MRCTQDPRVSPYAALNEVVEVGCRRDEATMEQSSRLLVWSVWPEWLAALATYVAGSCQMLSDLPAHLDRQWDFLGALPRP